MKKLGIKLFTGHYVMLLLKQNMVRQSASEAGVESDETPMVHEGYMVGMDDTYFFIGDEATSISAAIRRDEVTVVNISSPDKDNEEISLANKLEMN